jgi:hypothetical protein
MGADRAHLEVWRRGEAIETILEVVYENLPLVKVGDTVHSRRTTNERVERTHRTHHRAAAAPTTTPQLRR